MHRPYSGARAVSGEHFIAGLAVGVKLVASFWVGMMLTAAVVPDHAHAGGAWVITSVCLFVLTLPIEWPRKP